jgi:hypothetical protein
MNKYNPNNAKDDKKLAKAKITKIANQFAIDKDFKISNLNKYDIVVKDDPQYVTDFIHEIVAELRLKEVKNIFIQKINQASCTYFNYQNEINHKMRALLIDWLIEVRSY